MKKCAMVLIILTTAGVSFASAIWLPWLTPALSSVAEPRSDNTALLEPDVQVQQMHLIVQAGPVVTWQILAERATLSETRHQTMIRRVDAEIAGDTPDAWRITANRGLIDRTTGDMLVEGEVRIQQRQGYTINANELYWDTTGRILHTDTPVTMHGRNVTITGNGLHSQVEQGRITVEHDVRALFHLHKSP